MLRSLASTCLLVLALVTSGDLHAQPIDKVALDARVRGEWKADEPGMSVAISRDGELIYEGWTGQADLERGVPISRDTRFPIASTSKQFTAFAIMKLVDEGKLSLDQEVREFFPSFRASGNGVTIKHLLDHTSGLREVNTLTQILGFSDASLILPNASLELILRQNGRNFDPGTNEEYSNTGYQLLAHIVERASGVPFEDYIRTEIFEPLGMKDSLVDRDPTILTPNLALSYDPGRTAIYKNLYVSGVIGSSGIISSPRDLVRWGHALNTAQIGNANIIHAMNKRTRLANGNMAVASNGQEYREYRGLKTWSHGGSSGGFRSFLLRIPEENVVIAVIGNRSDFLKAAFAFDLAEALLADRLEPAPEPDMAPETIAELDSYAGDYRLFAGTVFSIRRDGDGLTFAGFGSGNPNRIERVSQGVFMVDPVRERRVEFRTFKDGKATELRWQVSEDGFIRAPRVAMQPIPDALSDPGLYTGSYYNDDLQAGFDISLSDEAQLAISSGLRGPVPLAPIQPGVLRPLGASPFAVIDVGSGTSAPPDQIIVSTTLAENFVFERVR
ncbi:MAG: serine hydrolase [Pseudomonadota bacterium]